jgi:hypothetical protein
MKRLLILLAACSSSSDEVVFDLRGEAELEVTKTFDVHGSRDVSIIGAEGHLVEAWASGTWFAPMERDALTVEGDGKITMTVWARGDVLAPVSRDRSLAWFDPAVLDDASVISFDKVMQTIGGGPALDRWFRAFAAGPGAGRATFAQFLDEVVAAQGADPSKWDLAKLPFKVTGVHNRVDLAKDGHCGELRVSIASTHPTFSPVHLIFLFRQPAGPDDVTPDGVVHCRGTARAWARLTTATDFHAAAKAVIAQGITHERFLLAESVELSISPWQWRQWTADFTNPPLFQTIDVARVNAPGALRDAFLADVAANATAIAERHWSVPPQYRSAVAEVQPNTQAAMPDVPGELARPLAMIGCPRCHTDTADFLQTSVDRKASPFYDKELDARAARLDALGRGESPPAPPFGPLQPQ